MSVEAMSTGSVVGTSAINTGPISHAFGGEFSGEIIRFSSIPPQEGQPPIKEEDKNLASTFKNETDGKVEIKIPPKSDL